jgi:hypothetical protein
MTLVKSLYKINKKSGVVIPNLFKKILLIQSIFSECFLDILFHSKFLKPFLQKLIIRSWIPKRRIFVEKIIEMVLLPFINN